MSGTIIVASNLPTAVRIETIPKQKPAPAGMADVAPSAQIEPVEPFMTCDIAGERGAENVGGYGITRDVDSELFAQWMAAHPEHRDAMKVVSEDELKKMTEAQHEAYGYEVGLKEAEAAEKKAPAAAAARPAAQHATKA
jgi:hypothetical protein